MSTPNQDSQNRNSQTLVSTAQVSRRRRRLDVSSLIWGLLFLAVAASALWVGSGRSLPWQVVRLGAPAFLICLGILGVVLSRRHSR